MNEKMFGNKLAAMRKERGYTQDTFAQELGITPQAVSKWENGHSLPETALLPTLAKRLDCSLDELFEQSNLLIVDAQYGDGYETVCVTKNLCRLIENDSINIVVSDAILGAYCSNDRIPYLLVKYQSSAGIGYAARCEGDNLVLNSKSAKTELPEKVLSIIHGSYGTRYHHYNVTSRINHYRTLGWKVFQANHEIFPSNPANDDTEYLTLVYLNKSGIHMFTCAEGEGITFSVGSSRLIRQERNTEILLPEIPLLPSFGMGMECSWAAALTAALQAMGIKTSYHEVMGVSGACYRLTFCSPMWDYSAADGSTVYDFAAPGYAAYGFAPELYSHVEKKDRVKHRQRIVNEISRGVPVMGINLRVAAEWGIICGYGKDGEELYCRTKYDRELVDGRTDLKTAYEYPKVDNWPYLLLYFTEQKWPPSAADNLRLSLRLLSESAAKTQSGGVYMGKKAYEVWAGDLQDEQFFNHCDSQQFLHRYSVNRFCLLALYDARKAAAEYLTEKSSILGIVHRERLVELAELFRQLAEGAKELYDASECSEEREESSLKVFWNASVRAGQAEKLLEMMETELIAAAKAGKLAETVRTIS